ncbi:Parkinson disease protein 7-like [Neocloeon triangulifer]|uniref:Parkinson disease protein 7-like n=1 Tax=Neocloeon triangulifer TaxID=2078957 RepID=UPI00286FA960|nr:Parkinson disease protein 7-like [Neocloeon triangulifer]
MTKTAIVLLAEGAEEMEFVTPVDVLRRAGVHVTVAGIAGSAPVKCSRDISVVPDEALESAVAKGPFDAVILPGGLKGSQNLAESAAVGALVKQQEAEGRIVAAICAAPTALKQHGVGKGKKVTSYPSTQAEMEKGGDYTYLQDRVVVDGNLITSRGPGTALEFALAITEALVGKEQADSLANGMLLKQ